MPIIVHYFVFHKEFSHDILSTPRSDDNRRTAGAVGLSASSFHYGQTQSSGYWRPAGRHLYYYRLFSCFSEKIFSKA
ncbi:MAG: hypothetical protein IKP87_04060 [Victivallales bacterium]|nr:hypothetical protein [Victivallales bacterium]